MVQKTAHDSGFCGFISVAKNGSMSRNASHLRPISLKYSGSSCCSVQKTRKSRKSRIASPAARKLA
jgi:hypothetical protein